MTTTEKSFIHPLKPSKGLNSNVSNNTKTNIVKAGKIGKINDLSWFVMLMLRIRLTIKKLPIGRNIAPAKRAIVKTNNP